MKSTFESVHFLALLIISGLVLFANEGFANQTPAPDSDTVVSSVSGSASPSDSTSSVTSVDGAVISSPTDAEAKVYERYKALRNARVQKNKQIFYLGICAGQTLAKQGIYLSDVASSATTATSADLKSSVKAAFQSCKAEAKARRDAASVSATPTPSPTPATTTTTASES